MAISAEPPNIILMPTKSPIAQAAVLGRPARIITPSTRSMTPLASIQPQRPDNSRLWSSENMIEATPMMKKATSKKVSDIAPLNGIASSQPPTKTASAADTSDHQKPGAWRIQNVVNSPMTPLTKNTQPNRIVTASVAIGGSRTATAPRTTRTTPSVRYSCQCACSAFATARWNLEISG